MIRRFNRFELKYVIDLPTRDAIREALHANMVSDPQAESDGAYPVTSLYYDSPALSCYWSKLEGIKYRRKLRIRIYRPHETVPSQPAMVEIKQRIDRTVQKRRLGLPLFEAYQLCRGHRPARTLDPQDDRVATEVEFMVRSLLLEPACVISYRRQAFVGSNYEAGLRITFDQQLSCRGPEAGLGAGAFGLPILSSSRVIMEVKVNDTVPLWVTRMLSRNQCTLRRVSKYCAGLSTYRASGGAPLSPGRALDG